MEISDKIKILDIDVNVKIPSLDIDGRRNVIRNDETVTEI